MSRSSYFCCSVTENPWNDIFGCGGTHQIPSDSVTELHGQYKLQDWNNPFRTDRSFCIAPTTAIASEQENRNDVRSVGSDDYETAATTRGISSNDERSEVNTVKKKRVTFKEPHVENMSPTIGGKKTMGSHSFLYDSFDYESDHSDQGIRLMTTEKVDKILKKKGLVRSPIDGRLIKKDSLSIKRKLQLLVMRTETTRAKKELTPEDVRDPETVSGMKLLADIEKEKKAKERAATMISTGEFVHSEKAGVALYTLSDRERVRRTDGKINPIV